MRLQMIIFEMARQKPVVNVESSQVASRGWGRINLFVYLQFIRIIAPGAICMKLLKQVMLYRYNIAVTGQFQTLLLESKLAH